MTLRAAEIETLFTANVDQVAQAEKIIKQTGQRVEKNPLKVDADTKGAIAGMDRVEQAAKKIVSKDVVATVDANIQRGEKSLDRVQKRLEYLRSVETELDVKADISRAEASLSKVQRNLDGLKSARATMEVNADTSAAEASLAGVADAAGEAGEDSGAEFNGSVIAALASIPIAGAVIGIGAAAGKALVNEFQDALQIEVGYDRLQALTGVSEGDALRLGRAAGEAYANNFGESIESNMDTARLALQFRILDPDATTRDAQVVVQGLAGIADVLGEDVRPVAQAVTQLLSNGLAKNATEAYDLIAAGARNGMNRNEDLIDTLTEYPSLFQRLGLSGEEAFGLVSQSMKAGARNSDLAADALKEFQIRATDASVLSASSFESLGLNAEEMTAKIARGGQEARDGLAEVLTKLRETEDPVLRNAAAVGLFGTQAEDLGASLFAMDLTTAVDQLDGVTGSAQRMFDTIAGNDASKIEQAQRNIEVAAEGIKGALASAFAEPLGDFADWVSQNRGPVTQFLMDLANGAIDFGVSMVNSGADATEALGTFVSGPLAFLTAGLAHVMDAMGQDGSAVGELSRQMQDFGVEASESADTMRTEWVGALEDARTKLNDFGDPIVALGYLNDAALRSAAAVSEVGVAADGSRLVLDGLDLTNLRTSESGRILQEQLDRSASSFQSELEMAIAAGESQQNLQDRYNATSDALMGQLTAMGLTQEQAQHLIDTVLQTPDEARTLYSSNADSERSKISDLGHRIVTLPDGSVVLEAETWGAEQDLNKTARDREATIYVSTRSREGGGRFATGGPITGPGGPKDDAVPILASNGEHMLTAREVAAAGGHSAIYRLRRALLNGGMRFADGGAIRTEPPSSTWRVGHRDTSAVPVSSGISVALPSSSVPAAPSVFHLYDADGNLITTMRGIARDESSRGTDNLRRR